MKHTPQQADYKLALLLRRCHTNVKGKLCHMPKALVSINTAPAEWGGGVSLRLPGSNNTEEEEKKLSLL